MSQQFRCCLFSALISPGMILRLTFRYLRLDSSHARFLFHDPRELRIISRHLN